MSIRMRMPCIHSSLFLKDVALSIPEWFLSGGSCFLATKDLKILTTDAKPHYFRDAKNHFYHANMDASQLMQFFVKSGKDTNERHFYAY